MKQFVEKNARILLAGVVLLLFGGLLIWRAFYGMDITDETFYLATARRFYDGDFLFKDDWNTGQIFGIIMLPLYQIYMLVHGSSEGIILCARILFVILEVFTACFLFRVLWYQTRSFGASLFAALCVMVYTRGNIITISYYSLGFLTFLLCILWWAESERQEGKERYLILSGISFAVSVLCMPYMTLLSVILTGIGIYDKIRGHGKIFRQVVWWGLGVLFSAVLFFLCFGKWIPWIGLLEYIPFVFQDTTLENEGLMEQLTDLFHYYGNVFLKYMWPVYGITFVLTFFVRKKRIHNMEIIPWILWIEFLVQSVYVRTYFEGGIIITFFLLAVQMQLLDTEYRYRQLETYFVLPGLLFGIAWLLGSNVGERAVNMSLLLVDLWAVPFLWKECEKYGIRIKTIMRLVVCLLFGVLLLIRLFDVYRDGSLWDLNYVVSCGSMKGIHTEADRGTAYEQTFQLLQEETTSEDILVVQGCNPWVYIDAPATCGSYTTWNIDEGEELMKTYYDVWPTKIPNAILSVSKEIDEYECWKYSSHGAGFHESEQSGLKGILKEILEKTYDYREKGGSVLYRRSKNRD